MEDQLKKKTTFILKRAQDINVEFHINDLNQPYKEKFDEPISGSIHKQIQYALDYLEANMYLKKDTLINYKLDKKDMLLRIGIL